MSEVLFGLIMVLTFTGSLSVADSGRDDVRAVLIGALGCNLAWGIIDAILYLMGCLAEKGKEIATVMGLRAAATAQEAQAILRDALPESVVSVLTSDELDALRERMTGLPEPPKRATLSSDDWRGALGVFLLVVLTTFPVAIPFLVMHELQPAMRWSNGVAVLMLFLAGEIFARMTGRRRWFTGMVMVLLGSSLVAMTIALGG
ncbi:MAG: VIT1/CCC1 transporter family protein [Verrucomicrobiales bacterium]